MVLFQTVLCNNLIADGALRFSLYVYLIKELLLCKCIHARQ